MAAHHYRALLMSLGSISLNSPVDLKRQAELLKHAIGHAPAFAYLPWETYDEIASWCTAVESGAEEDYKMRDKFFVLMMKHLPRIGQEWLDLGMPRCAEDWGRAKYPAEEE